MVSPALISMQIPSDGVKWLHHHFLRLLLRFRRMALTGKWSEVCSPVAGQPCDRSRRRLDARQSLVTPIQSIPWPGDSLDPESGEGVSLFAPRSRIGKSERCREAVAIDQGA
jgi:hypothetical protein